MFERVHIEANRGRGSGNTARVLLRAKLAAYEGDDVLLVAPHVSEKSRWYKWLRQSDPAALSTGYDFKCGPGSIRVVLAGYSLAGTRHTVAYMDVLEQYDHRPLSETLPWLRDLSDRLVVNARRASEPKEQEEPDTDTMFRWLDGFKNC